MKKVTTHSVPRFFLTIPAGEDEMPAEFSRFLDAVLTATKNILKRENEALRRFKPTGRVVTTYRGPLSNTVRERKNKTDNKC
jgi:hypothetical protein